MDLLLSFAAIAIVVMLGYLGYLEWQKATKERRMEILSRLIKAAELSVTSGVGAHKKEWVMDRLEGYFPGIDREELDQMVEAGVYELKRIVTINPSVNSDVDDRGGAFWYGTGRHN